MCVRVRASTQYICIYMYVCMYVSIYIYIYIYIHTYIYIYIYIYTHTNCVRATCNASIRTYFVRARAILFMNIHSKRELKTHRLQCTCVEVSWVRLSHSYTHVYYVPYVCLRVCRVYMYMVHCICIHMHIQACLYIYIYIYIIICTHVCVYMRTRHVYVCM
jgi:hypothetical protein